MKKILKRILQVEKYRSYKAVRSTKRKLSVSGKGKKIYLLNIPEHGNLGDQAIYIAEKKWCHDYLPGYEVCGMTHRETKYAMKHILRSVKEGDIIGVHGGGYIGSIWPAEHGILVDILREFKDKKIVVLPQTVYFSDCDSMLKDEMKHVIKECKDITIFLRDKKSYDIMLDGILDQNRCVYTPDIVTYMNLKLKDFNREGILMCLRTDKEKVENVYIGEVEKYARKREIRIEYTDTVLHRKLNEEQGEEQVVKKLEEFKKYELVVTDRLHGMIFATISGTPCIAFDNVSKKVSGVYRDWIQPVKYVKCIKEGFDIKFVDELMNMKAEEYNNKYLENEYKNMKEKFLGTK